MCISGCFCDPDDGSTIQNYTTIALDAISRLEYGLLWNVGLLLMVLRLRDFKLNVILKRMKTRLFYCHLFIVPSTCAWSLSSFNSNHSHSMNWINACFFFFLNTD